jgi:hypothetical protein
LLTVSVVDPEMLPEVAVMSDGPAPVPVARPPAVIVATLGVAEPHVTLPVMFCVLESL